MMNRAESVRIIKPGKSMDDFLSLDVTARQDVGLFFVADETLGARVIDLGKLLAGSANHLET